jgi:hypothetical protein
MGKQFHNSQNVLSSLFSDSIDEEDFQSESPNTAKDESVQMEDANENGLSQDLFNGSPEKKSRTDSL